MVFLFHVSNTSFESLYRSEFIFRLLGTVFADQYDTKFGMIDNMKHLEWISSSCKDLKEMPPDVKSVVGYAVRRQSYRRVK